jgi:hypothetical protein
MPLPVKDTVAVGKLNLNKPSKHGELGGVNDALDVGIKNNIL